MYIKWELCMIQCYHVAWQPPKITIDMLIICFKVEAAVPLNTEKRSLR